MKEINLDAWACIKNMQDSKPYQKRHYVQTQPKKKEVKCGETCDFFSGEEGSEKKTHKQLLYN